ncbi:MAG: SLBB domain-containing protein [Actinomycetota bacterium]
MTTFLQKLGRENGGWWIAAAVCVSVWIAPARAADPAPDAEKKPATPPAAAAPVKGLLDRGHLLGPGDTVDIVVDGYPQFSKTVKLFADGSFDYPVLESVYARGITTAELRDRIVEGFRKELRRPIVYVSLVDIYVPPPPPAKEIPKFIALGPIARKGEIPIPEPKPFRQILQELGPSDSADLTNIRIKYSDAPAKYIDASTFAKEGVIKDDILIRGGEEIILVEKPPPPPIARINVQVLGHVMKAGSAFSLEGKVPILDVIDRAGGPKPGAAMDRVKVMNGSKERIVDVEKYRGGDVDANYFCADGDIILLSEKELKVIVFGEVSRPGDVAIDKGETLSDLVMAAGMTGQADRRGVELIRKDKDGNVKRTKVDIINIQRQKKDDVTLVDGDVLYVGPKNKKKGILGYLGAIASPLWLLRSINPAIGF